MQEAQAGPTENITVVVDEGTDQNGCPEDVDPNNDQTGINHLPVKDNVIYVHYTDAYVRDDPQSEWELDTDNGPPGCFIDVSGDDPDPGDFQGAKQDEITVHSDGSGSENFILDLTGAGDGESADDNTASILCVGEKNEEYPDNDLGEDDWVGIFAPLQIHDSGNSASGESISL